MITFWETWEFTKCWKLFNIPVSQIPNVLISLLIHLLMSLLINLLTSLLFKLLIRNLGPCNFGIGSLGIWSACKGHTPSHEVYTNRPSHCFGRSLNQWYLHVTNMVCNSSGGCETSLLNSWSKSPTMPRRNRRRKKATSAWADTSLTSRSFTSGTDSVNIDDWMSQFGGLIVVLWCGTCLVRELRCGTH